MGQHAKGKSVVTMGKILQGNADDQEVFFCTETDDGVEFLVEG